MGQRPLDAFNPLVRDWFAGEFDGPTAAQRDGWPAIASGDHTLVLAPTGSGKTLASFLWSIDRLLTRPAGHAPPGANGKGSGVRLLYVSPLKALNYDIERNLRQPLDGVRALAESRGIDLPEVRVGVRTGDTSSSTRASILRRPPEILITTPESLYLMLSSPRARHVLDTVEWVIVDEIHAVAASKRGTHLTLSLERLAEQHPAGGFQRIGLSATAKPVETIAALLGGHDDEGSPRPVTVVDATRADGAPTAGPLDLEVAFLPVAHEDFPDERVHRAFAEAARRVLDEVRAHRATLVFLPSRGLVEKMVEVVNDLAGDELVHAHHGSVAHERRRYLEESLKRGDIAGIVCTSSLEMGIDMGPIDCVLQYSSPRGAAAGLQRVGRSGHGVGRVRKGRIFSPHPNDLLESAAVVAAMHEGDIEPVSPPDLCLDVLAQHVVSMVAVGPRSVGDVLRVARRAAPYRDLSRPQLDNVVRMLEGGFADQRYKELSPRLVHDHATDTLLPRPGILRLATTNGGTIPDRGEYTVRLATGGEIETAAESPKIGELDEEFVGDLGRDQVPFILGSSTWKALRIDHSNVWVRPAPGEVGEPAFWNGEKTGRHTYLGRRVAGLATQIAERLDDDDALQRLLHDTCKLDRAGVEALASWFRDQRDATGIVPAAQAVPVEWFHDEIGDLRIVIHSLFGLAVNGAWAHALKPIVRNRFDNLDPQVMWTSDGIIVRLPALEGPPDLSFIREVHAGNVHELLIGELADAPMYALRFRESAQRALLLPRPSPVRRTPLWLQRQRAADLLQVVRRKPGFPVVQEAVRECYQELWDVEGLRTVLRDIEADRIASPELASPSPSPFAASLDYAFAMAFREAGDAPRGECRAAFLALDRSLLDEVLAVEELRDLLDPAVVAEVRADLARAAPGRRARRPHELLAILTDLGDLSTDELLARCDTVKARPAPGGVLTEQARGWIDDLAVQGSIVRHHDTGRWVAAADARRTVEHLLMRHVQWAGPVTLASLATRYELPERAVRSLLDVQEQNGSIASGHYLPDGHAREWCDPEVVQRLHRLSLARARAQIEPVPLPHYADFLVSRQLDATVPSATAALGRLRNLPIAVPTWERGLIPARLGRHDTQALDAACADGGWVWRGRGRGLVVLSPRGSHPSGFSSGFSAGPSTGPSVRSAAGPEGATAAGNGSPQGSAATDEAVAPGSLSARVLDALAVGGAWFAGELAARLGLHGDDDLLTDALYSLLWKGLVTTDSFAPLRWWREVWLPYIDGTGRAQGPLVPPGRWQHHRPIPFPTTGAPATGEPSSGGTASPARSDDAAAVADELLERYGVVTKHHLRAERRDIRWPSVYAEMKRREMRGAVVRGLFVEGLEGAQFARSAVVDALREHERSTAPRLVNGADPANVWGRIVRTGDIAVVSTPDGDVPAAGIPETWQARRPGSHVVVEAGRPVALVGGWGTDVWLLGAEPADPSVTARLATLGSLAVWQQRTLRVQRCDGRPILGSEWEAAFRHAGFSRHGASLVLTPDDAIIAAARSRARQEGRIG